VGLVEARNCKSEVEELESDCGVDDEAILHTRMGYRERFRIQVNCDWRLYIMYFHLCIEQYAFYFMLGIGL
jgi:hypothetical protein